jgi:hypothetical protein
MQGIVLGHAPRVEVDEVLPGLFSVFSWIIIDV